MSRPILMLPGWGMKASVFSPLLDELSAPDAQALPLPAGKTLDECAAQIAPLLTSDHILCGWSLGGMLALQRAALHPPAALVLIGVTPRFVATEDWPEAVSPADFAAFDAHLARDPAGLMRHFIQLQCMGLPNARAQARALSAHLIEDTDTLRAGLSLLRETDLRGLAPDVPTLIIHGQHDKLVPLAAARALCNALPQAQRVVVEGAGHAPHFTHPEVVANHLRTWMATLP